MRRAAFLTSILRSAFTFADAYLLPPQRLLGTEAGILLVHPVRSKFQIPHPPCLPLCTDSHTCDAFYPPCSARGEQRRESSWGPSSLA